METGIIILLAALALGVILFAAGYLKAPPDTAFIISGLGKKRILIGKAGWRIPFLERVDKLSLQVMTVDVKTSEAVPTNEFINVMVDGVANVKISSDPALLTRAAESLLGMKQPQLIAMVTQVLEGNMREIVGSVGLKEMVQDRQGVAKKITENVVPDMQKLGIEVVNFNIQNFRDNAGTIENMGIDNVEQIRKNAQIAKANAQRDIAIASSVAQQEANAVKVDSEKKIAAQNAELTVQQAEMQVRADTKRAEADAAYSIQTAMASDLYSGRLSAVKDVKDSDDGTVTVTLARANTQFPALLNIPVIENDAADSTYPSGTGLYQFASDHQSLTVYSGHPDADKAPVDTVYLMECKSVEEIVSAFDNGQLDLALSDPSSGTDLSFSSLNDQRQYATTNLQYVGFNTNSSFFMTARYRQPFNYVIDRAFAVALLHDCAVATALPVHPASTLYDNALNESLSYDLDKAKKLFDELKIVDYDGDGEREYMPDGQSPLDISLSLIVYADSTAKVSMANKIAADLTSIGIPVKVRELSWDNYQDALKGGKFDMYYGEVALPADFDLSALLKAGGSLNYGGITTGTYADVINAYLTAADSDRAAACSTMLQTISDNAPIVPVCFEKHCLYVHRGAVGGFSPTKYNIFHNITDWKINNA